MTTLIPKFDLKNGSSTPANAINRPINEKLSESVSVLDFGADDTGVADSTTAFQNAIDSNSSVFIPAGTYKITDTITVPANKQLYGVGLASDLVVTITAGDYAIYAGDSTVALNYGISLSNFNITLTTAATKGIMLYGTCAAQVLNVRVQGSEPNKQIIGFAIDGGNQSSFFNYLQNCHVSHCNVGFDILKSGSSYATQQVFIDCSVTGDYSSGDTSSIGYNFSNTPAGVDSCIFGGNCENLGIGINLTSITGVTVNGLRFEGCNVDINSDAFTNGCSFIACKNIDSTLGFPSNQDGYGNNSIIACTGSVGKNNIIESDNTFYSASTTGLPVKIVGSATQTGSLLRTTNSAGSALFDINANGSITTGGVALASGASTLTIGFASQTTVGAAGGASALPATPLGYLIAYLGSTKILIPYYSA
jgi:hypothetical protein